MNGFLARLMTIGGFMYAGQYVNEVGGFWQFSAGAIVGALGGMWVERLAETNQTSESRG